MLTCVCDDRQLFGPYFDSLDSGSANKYSPSINNEEKNNNKYTYWNVVIIIEKQEIENK